MHNRSISTKTHWNNQMITLLEQHRIDISFLEYSSITFDIRSLLNGLIKIQSSRGDIIYKSMLLEIANFIQLVNCLHIIESSSIWFIDILNFSF